MDRSVSKIVNIHIARTFNLDEKEVARLRKDFLTFMKNVRKGVVKTPAHRQELTVAFTAWSGDFEKLGRIIRDSLQGRVRQWKHQIDRSDTWNKRELSHKIGWGEYYLNNMNPFWDFLSEIWGLPEFEVEPVRDEGELRDRFRENGISDYEADQYLLHNPLPTEEELIEKGRVKWQAKANKWDKRISRKARLAWKFLKELIEWTNAPWSGSDAEPISVITPTEEVTDLEGFRFMMRGFDESTSEIKHQKLQLLKVALKKFRKRANKVLPMMIRGSLPFIVDWTFHGQSDGDAAAVYERSHIRITPWGLSSNLGFFVQMLAHEMGHHIFQTHLSKGARDFWYAAVKGDYGDFDLRTLVSTMKSLGEDWYYDSKKLAQSDPILYLQAQTLLFGMYKNTEIGDRGGSLEDLESYLSKGKNPIIKVPKSPISGYAAKNPEESFCEAIGKLVSYGPKSLPDTVLGWLKMVLPNVKFAKTAKKHDDYDYKKELVTFALCELLSFLRALRWCHETGIWQIVGENLQGDRNLLNDAKYNLDYCTERLADQVTGAFGSEQLDPTKSMNLSLNILSWIGDVDCPLKRSMLMEKRFLEYLMATRNMILSTEHMTAGLDKILMDMAEHHERQHTLLKKRLTVRVGSIRVASKYLERK